MSSSESLNKFREKLISSILELRTKREALNEEIGAEEKEKTSIEAQLPGLSMRLSRSNDILQRKKATLAEIEKAVEVVTISLSQIKESSEKYEQVCKKEAEYHEKRKTKAV